MNVGSKPIWSGWCLIPEWHSRCSYLGLYDDSNLLMLRSLSSELISDEVLEGQPVA